MSKLSEITLFSIVVALFIGLGFSAAPAFANNSFDLYVNHNVNGRSFGLDQALPVDVYVNGAYVFTFEFGEDYSTELPADTYTIDLKLANTSTTVMSLGPVDIPADADVTIRATLSAEKTPTMQASIN